MTSSSSSDPSQDFWQIAADLVPSLFVADVVAAVVAVVVEIVMDPLVVTEVSMISHWTRQEQGD